MNNKSTKFCQITLRIEIYIYWQNVIPAPSECSAIKGGRLNRVPVPDVLTVFD